MFIVFVCVPVFFVLLSILFIFILFLFCICVFVYWCACVLVFPFDICVCVVYTGIRIGTSCGVSAPMSMYNRIQIHKN